jgi:hypothetical protein
MKNLEEKGEVKLELKSAVSKGQILLDHDAIDQDTNIFGNNYWYHSWYYRTHGTYKNIEYLINTNFGILADKVGSGKTLMVVGLIVESLTPPNNPKILNSTQFTSIKYLDDIQAIKTNLILIPHNYHLNGIKHLQIIHV